MGELWSLFLRVYVREVVLEHGVISLPHCPIARIFGFRDSDNALPQCGEFVEVALPLEFDHELEPVGNPGLCRANLSHQSATFNDRYHEIALCRGWRSMWRPRDLFVGM